MLSRRFVSAFRNAEYQTINGKGAWVVDLDAPVLAVAGVIRPRIIVSRALVHKLSEHQLDVAIRHESAHVAARDNLTRLLLMSTPGLGCRALEDAWCQHAERAADDAAAADSRQQRLDLAEALVVVSRLGINPSPPLVTAFAADTDDLSRRVDRLVSQEGASNPCLSQGMILAVASMAVGSAVILGMAFRSESVHRTLELLVR
jgi:beta-lactamase regulating signal transducer with metallopeptidase domain